MFPRAVVLCVLSTGCFETYHWPTCREIERRPIDDLEETPAGTAADLRAAVSIDGTFPGTWWDETPAEVDVWVTSEGQAEWVATEPHTEVTRSLGIGSYYPSIAVLCYDSVQVPLHGEVRTADERLEVVTDGIAASQSNDEGVPEIGTWLDGPFAEAVFPATEEDPQDWSDKSSFVALQFAEAGFVEGSAGWGGERETPEAHSSMAEYVVRFFAE